MTGAERRELWRNKRVMQRQAELHPSPGARAAAIDALDAIARAEVEDPRPRLWLRLRLRLRGVDAG